ncbi:MAG TPA: hypothetical protein VFS97_02175 [Nitrososphaeraceae archaeon]|nr:hypothetical protein [Nitrososphaeraceae archaeon]
MVGADSASTKSENLCFRSAIFPSTYSLRIICKGEVTRSEDISMNAMPTLSRKGSELFFLGRLNPITSGGRRSVLLTFSHVVG